MIARGHLIFIKHNGRDGSIYPVTTPTCSVGRGYDNDIRIYVQSVSEVHCEICTSDFQPAVLKNLSSINPTKVNNVSIRENEHYLEHGDMITTGER
ncbi:Antigen KI-67 [Zootermopsis nevadensis]|nr:Antigen KI-67 [Zootermopsis nevadensis]KDR09127.1 Antigen KI-67 [Zootermopsis nevadensis]